MNPSVPLAAPPSGVLRRDTTAADRLPRQQAQWIVGQLVAGAVLATAGLWQSAPTLALTLSLGVGVALVSPRRLLASPLTVALIVAAGLAFEAARLPAIVGAGAMAGLVTAWLVPQSVQAMDSVNAALATSAAAALGLWVASQLLPEGLGTVGEAALTCGLVGLVASQGLWPLALSADAIVLPTPRAIQRTLPVAYRQPVFESVRLAREGRRRASERSTKVGLVEVARWVFDLQIAVAGLDEEIDVLDPEDLRARIERYRSEQAHDEFTRERRHATADHLVRLLAHREALVAERQRNAALVDYAMAFLEEARAGLIVAHRLPGEAAPDRLPEVLQRLRREAADGEARRRTAREINALRA